MKVLTLDDVLFLKKCHLLYQLVEKSEFVPDLVIPIAAGGVYVAENMVFKNADIQIVDLKRATSSSKKKYRVSALLKKLPYCILDALRIIESKMLETAAENKTLDALSQDKVRASLNIKPKNKSILIIDDAVDSGNTLLAVTQVVKELAIEGADIRSCVLAVTTKSPKILPNYMLIRGDLLRFPWSNDFKG